MPATFADYLTQLQGNNPALPATPDYSGAFGTLPGMPNAGDTPTVELRRLYLEMLSQQNAAAQYRQQAQQAQQMGNAQLAAQLAAQAQNIEQQNLMRQQQADQFASTYGLQQQAQEFQQGLANRQFELQRTGQQFQQGLAAGQLTGQYNNAPTLAQQQLTQAGQQFGQTLGLQQGQALGLINNQETLAARQQREQNALAAGGLTGTYGGQQTLAAELGRGGLGLQQRQQAFNEEQFLAQQAANPNNLIVSALSQGARTPGGAQPQQAPAAVGTASAGGAPTLSAQPPTFAGATGSQNPMLQQQVPVAANVANLLQRNRIPQYGAAQSSGFMTSLQNLREDPNLRLRPGALDAVSLRNTLSNPEEAGYLSSTLQAQGQQPSTFMSAINAGQPRRRAGMVRAT